MSRNPRVLCAGSLALNDTVFSNGRTSMADPGGNALYAAVGARVWSGEVVVAAVVGADWPSDHTDKLRALGVGTDLLSPLSEPSLRAWTIYEADGHRRYLSRNGPVVRRTPNPFRPGAITPQEAAQYASAAAQVHRRSCPKPPPREVIETFDVVHLCPMPFECLQPWIDAVAPLEGVSLTVDSPPFSPDVEPEQLRALLGGVDAFLPSEAEVESLQPGADPAAFCRAMAELGPSMVVVKQGARGAVLFEAQTGTLRHIPPVPCEAVDPTGAGDAFCGGFAIGLATCGDPHEAALRGAISASHIIEGFGALHPALPTSKETSTARLERLRGQERKR